MNRWNTGKTFKEVQVSCLCSVVSDSETQWTIYSLPGSYPWNFPGKKYWSGLPFPPPGDLPHPGIKPGSPALVDRFFTTEPVKVYEQEISSGNFS